MTGCVYFKSGIGNLIQATPAMQALAGMTDSGRVDVCLDAAWTNHDSRVDAIRSILEASPFVGKVIRHPQDELGKYTTWFIPLQCETSKAGHFVLSKMKLKNWPTHNWEKSLHHEVDVNMHYLRKLTGYDGLTPKKFMPVSDSGPSLGHLPKPLIGLCNGAFGTRIWEKKHWPYFQPLARLLKRYYQGTLIGVGGKKELPGVPLDRDYTGELPILESAKVIQQLDCLITTDTSCMHMADALNVRTLALFGPTLASKNAPRSPRCRIIRAPMECAPCQYTERFYSCQVYACMEQITPAIVMRHVRELIRNS